MTSRDAHIMAAMLAVIDDGERVRQLADETLVEKHRRLMQAKCQHGEVYSFSVSGPAGTNSTHVCLECGKTWNETRSR